MANIVKLFWEMDRDLTEEFYGLQKFNDFLESHSGLLLKDIQGSYLRVLWEKDFESHKFSYSELDFAVKQVVEESGRWVNIILEFIQLKYQDKTKIVTLTFLKNLPFLWDFDKIHDFVQTLFIQQKWHVQIWIPKHGTLCIHYDFTHENFFTSLDLLKKNIESELVKLFPKEKSV